MAAPPVRETASRPRSAWAVAVAGAAAAVTIVALLALGTWQVYRLGWKLDLIARVDARVHAAPVALPGPAAWSSITASDDEYRHVVVTGTFLNDRETLVQAVTALGGGDWVITPLRTTGGALVLINRGFVDPAHRAPASRAAGLQAGATSVTGLLRITEPKGGFLRSNDAAADRWYSRDVAAIAATRHLTEVAPYFIDADAAPNPGGWPVGGLTVISFPNNHLVYAVTWYALAVLLAGATWWALREEWRARRGGGASARQFSHQDDR